MKTRITRLFGLPGMITVIIVLAGCHGDGELQNESVTIELEEAESVRAMVKLGSGSLSVAGGAEKLLEADFAYNVAGWKPEIQYRVREKQGELTITQPGTKSWWMRAGTRNDWKLRFNRNIPLDLRFIQRAAKSMLNLGNLNIHKMSLQVAKSDVTADLSGDHSALSRLDIDMEGGTLTIGLTGTYASLTRMKTNASSGKIDMDLAGAWHCDLKATFRSTSGDIRLHLPEDAGVRIKTKTITGKVEDGGLHFENGVYLNEAYGKSTATLDLELYSSSGDIILTTGK